MARSKREKITKRAQKKRNVLHKKLDTGIHRSVGRLRKVYKRRRKQLNNAVKRQRAHAAKRGD